MNVQSKMLNALDALLLSCVAAAQLSVWVIAMGAAAAPTQVEVSAPIGPVAQVIETIEVRG